MRRSTALKSSAALLVLLFLAAAYLSIMSYWERREEEIHVMFMKWKPDCNKTYNSTGEEEHRYAVFKENIRHGHNRVCIFADRTSEELGAGEPCDVDEAELADRQVLSPLVEEARDGRGGAVSSY